MQSTAGSTRAVRNPGSAFIVGASGRPGIEALFGRRAQKHCEARNAYDGQVHQVAHGVSDS